MFNLLKDKLIVIPWGISVIATVLSGFMIAVNFSRDNSQFVINYYHTLKPILGDVSSLYSILGVLVGLLLMNLALCLYVYPRQKFLSYVISIATLAVSLIFFITIFTLTSIN